MASMTYLSLCQLAGRYLRSGNAVPGLNPLNIPILIQTDQVYYDIVDAMPRAWEWVQNEHPSWDFMRKQGSLTLTSGQRTYTLAQIQTQITDYYKLIPFWAGSGYPYVYVYDVGASTPQYYPYPFVEYIEWRGIWDRLPRPANFQPTKFTELPNKTIECDPAPNLAPSGGQWGIRFDYKIKNQILVNNGDVPILPPEFHELIMWVCVRMVCESRMNNDTLLASAIAEISSYMGKLKALYLPQVQIELNYA